jgi:hypothetical protein
VDTTGWFGVKGWNEDEIACEIVPALGGGVDAGVINEMNIDAPVHNISYRSGKAYVRFSHPSNTTCKTEDHVLTCSDS